MSWAGALFAVVAFLLLAKSFKVPRLAQAVLGSTRRAFGDLRDPALGELEKERAMRSHARRLLGLSAGMLLASLAAASLPLGLLAVLDAFGVVDLHAVLRVTITPSFLLVASALGVGVAWFWRGLHR